MSGQKTVISALDQALQLHESETVIELGPDRILQFIGVRLVIILGIAVKLTEILVGNISCHPVRNETGYSGDFIKYAEAYCWESPQIKVDEKELCNIDSNIEEDKLLKEPIDAINVLRWMPYALLFQAFLFSLPSAWWHFRVGGRLMGHLKFMKLFIQRMYEKVKDVPAGIYHEEGYYDGSSHIDGWEEPEHDKDDVITFANEKTPGIKEEVGKILGKVLGESLDWKNKKDGVLENSKIVKTETFQKRIYGIKRTDESKMLDRHLFSMLCYENFSSLEHYPYILSIFQLTFLRHFEDEKGTYPMDQAILRQWCHDDNFSGRFLIIRYYLKHVFGIILSLAMMRAVAFVFEILGSEVWQSENFLCNALYYEDEYIICTLHRKTEMLAFLILDFLIIVMYLIISSSHLYFTSRSRYRETSLFFERINDSGSFGMLAALRQKQVKDSKNK